MELITAVVSLIISIITVGVSYYTFQRTLKTGIRPVLVFSRRSSMIWQVENVGNGPAISVVIGAMDRKGNWQTVINCYPISASAKVTLDWIIEGYEVAVVYTDVYGKTFTTHCHGNRNEIIEKNKFSNWKPARDEWFFALTTEQGCEGCLTEEDLQGKTAMELDLMRNEIFARHGFEFRRQDLKSYFATKSWYQPDTNDHSVAKVRFSDLEIYNSHFILDFQLRNGKVNREDVNIA